MREPTVLVDGRNFDLRSISLENNIVLLDTDFNPHMASIIVQQLLHLDTIETEKPVEIYINSPGGCVVSGLAIYDTIKSMRRDVEITAIGMCASMGAFILACGGTKGKRFVTANAQVMFHEISSGTSGRLSDMEVSYVQSTKLNTKLHKMIAKATGQKFKILMERMQKDIWLEGKEVLDFGAADEVI